MTTEEILEGNKLIAEFMGAKIIVENYHGINIIKFPDKSTKDLFGLKYNTSWDWLMPVVEKIEQGNYAVIITQNVCTIRACIMGDTTIRAYQNGNYLTPNTKLSNTWLAVIQFIKWYNEKFSE